MIANLCVNGSVPLQLLLKVHQLPPDLHGDAFSTDSAAWYVCIAAISCALLL
jgi:hypothetical protein